ncbi:EcsC family protein [Sporichthya brevicatena]|uniref:EcsC family protein n=1 Tax=Sporichthya brevicatena TaxID=171442 RepID=A0ABN1H435_9ACTN
MTVEAVESANGQRGLVLVQKILDWGVDGLGPLKSAEDVAREHLAQHRDVEVAIDRLIRTHARTVTATGFATGFGGFAAMGVMLPADITAFYAQAARCAAAVAHLRGYDIHSEEVRSIILLTLLGSAGVGVAAEFGVKLGTKASMAALKKLPGKALTAINQRVGFRLVTKFGSKGLINLGRAVPFVGAGVGAGINAVGMRSIGTYAKSNFPAGDVVVESPTVE